MFLPGFSSLGSTGPIEKLRGGHKGEKLVIRDGRVSECIILHMSMRRGRYFMDAANWVFCKDAITN